MPKLLILTNDSQEYLDLLQKANLPDLEIFTEFNPECDIVFGNTKEIKDTLPNLPHLKWVQTTSAGVERLMDPALRRDYTLTNARDVFGESMSEFVFGYMLFFKKRIRPRVLAQRAKQWDDFDDGVLRGKTLGLLGVGSIGAHIALTAKHFRMKVKGYTRASEDCKDVDEYFHPSPQPHPKGYMSPSGRGGIIAFADGLDYLVSVLPRTENTNQIVNAELLNALPSQSHFINVGRGNAVDNTALMNALNENKIAAAVLDVTEPEPLPEDHPFWTTDNLFLTFHTSAMSYPEDMVNLFTQNYKLYVEEKSLNHLVDFERGY